MTTLKTTVQFSQWNTASKSLSETIISALEAIKKYNYQVIILHKENSEHSSPVRQPSKSLNNPFAWKCTSQFHRNDEEMQDAVKRALNDTERDLLQNWTWIFGEPKAIKLYEEKGICTEGLFKGIGTCSQVRIKDMVKYLRENGENDRADLWEAPQYFNSGLWTPVNSQYYEPQEGLSYAVYFNDNKENFDIEKLNEILDDSIKNIVLHP